MWLYIEPYIHISSKKGKAILYNTINGKSIIIDRDKDLLDLIIEIDVQNNLRVVKISNDLLHSIKVKAFLSKIRKHYFGDLLNSDRSKIKPVQIPPLPKVQKDIKRLIDLELDKTENLSSYLNEISVYICSQMNNRFSILNDAFKQFLICRSSSNEEAELEMIHIEELIKGLSLSIVNILGGNIFCYSEFDRLVTFFTHTDYRSRIFLIYTDILANKNKLEKIQKANIDLNISVPCPFSREILDQVVKLLNQLHFNCSFTFVVTNDQEVAMAEKIKEELEISKMILQPYYNGSNMAFFKKRVFLTKNDIINSNPTMKEIIQRREINPQSFGRLTVLNDGSVYANVNKPSLGRIGIESAREIVLREIKQRSHWFITRHDIEPCKECIFEYLCPSPSNYENIIGKHDLCHVSKSMKN